MLHCTGSLSEGVTRGRDARECSVSRPIYTILAWVFCFVTLQDFLVRAEQQGGRLVSQAFSPSESEGEDRAEEKQESDEGAMDGGSRRHSAFASKGAADEGEEEEEADEKQWGGAGNRTKPSRFSHSGEGYYPTESDHLRLSSAPASSRRYPSVPPFSVVIPGSSLQPTSGSVTGGASSYWRGGGRSFHYRGNEGSTDSVVDILKGMGIWVLSGDDLYPKDSLDLLVIRLGGRLYQTLCPEVKYVIAAEASFRTRALMAMLSTSTPPRHDSKKRGQSSRGGTKRLAASAHNKKGRENEKMSEDAGGKHLSPSPSDPPFSRPSTLPLKPPPPSPSYSVPPVLHFRWLLECAQLGKAIPLRPDLVIHGTAETKEYFSECFDRFGDSWFEDALDLSPKELHKFRDLLLRAEETSGRGSASRGGECGEEEQEDLVSGDAGSKEGSGIRGGTPRGCAKTSGRLERGATVAGRHDQRGHPSVQERSFLAGDGEEGTVMGGEGADGAAKEREGEAEGQQRGEGTAFLLSSDMARWVLKQHVLRLAREITGNVHDGRIGGSGDKGKVEGETQETTVSSLE